MKTFRRFFLMVFFTGCIFFTSCKDEDNDSLMTAKYNSEKIEQYGVTTASFRSSTLDTDVQQKVYPFKIELPFIIFDDVSDNQIALHLNNLINITYIKNERYLILYFE